jgi:hypothetical protein
MHEPDARDRALRQAVERAIEREEDRKLIIQLINAGYRALAKELHPDIGGSTAAMARLLVCARHCWPIISCRGCHGGSEMPSTERAVSEARLATQRED